MGWCCCLGCGWWWLEAPYGVGRRGGPPGASAHVGA